MYKYLILTISLLTFSGKAMEMPEKAIQKPQILTYDEARDGQETREFFKKNWGKIYYGKPYSEELARALLDTTDYPEPAFSALKKVKVLRNPKLVGISSVYRFYKRPSDAVQGWLEMLNVDQTLPKKDIQENEDRLMVTALEDLHEMGTPSTEMYVLKDDASGIAQAEKFGWERIGETPAKKGWRYLYKHTPEQAKKLMPFIKALK